MSNKEFNIWEEFAKETNGKFIEEFSWHSAKTEIDYKDLKIIFDNYTLWSGKYSTKMTRIIVPFNSVDNSCDIKIKDFKRKINLEIKRDSIKLYKFIYVDRDFENDSLKITYTKNHIPVK